VSVCERERVCVCVCVCVCKREKCVSFTSSAFPWFTIITSEMAVMIIKCNHRGVYATREYSNAPGVDYTNILCATFTLADPKSAKKTDGLNVFFELLGSARIKALPKMLVKLPLLRRFLFKLMNAQLCVCL